MIKKLEAHSFKYVRVPGYTIPTVYTGISGKWYNHIDNDFIAVTNEKYTAILEEKFKQGNIPIT